MFESMTRTDRLDPARRIVTFLASLTAHFLAILILVVIPLIFLGTLPAVDLLSWVTYDPPSPPPPPPQINMRSQDIRQEPIRTNDFTTPREIPPGIPKPPSEPPWTDLPAGPNLGFTPDAFGPRVPGIQGNPLGTAFNVAPPAPLPPPPKPEPPKEPRRMTSSLQESRLIRKVDPVYPPLAVIARQSAIVILDVKVDEDGNVENVRVLQGHPLFNDAAIRAVMLWKYSPTILNGEPIPVVATVTVIFNLRPSGLF
jgi:protein TonB